MLTSLKTSSKAIFDNKKRKEKLFIINGTFVQKSTFFF